MRTSKPIYTRLLLVGEIEAINIKFGSNYKLVFNQEARVWLIWGDKFQTEPCTYKKMWIYMQGIRLGKMTSHTSG